MRVFGVVADRLVDSMHRSEQDLAEWGVACGEERRLEPPTGLQGRLPEALSEGLALRLPLLLQL